MAHKKRMTVANVLLALRQQLLTAHAEKNKNELGKLMFYADNLCEVAETVGDPKAVALLEDFAYAASHFIMEVDFKALAALPSIEAIQELETASAKYTNVLVKLIRRVIVKKEIHPLSLDSNSIAEEKIEPDWIGIAFTQGPYRDTFDALFYKSDGQLVSWYSFDTLEQAYRHVEEKYGIQVSEWEACEIEITDDDSRFIWNFEDK